MSIENPFAGKKLLAPGPVPLPDFVKDSFSQIECHHRSSEFQAILMRVFSQLKSVFQTQSHCYMLSATGTGGLEAAMVNCMRRDRKALFINAGKFGERWGKIAKAYGVPFDELVFEWGEDIDLNLVEDKLRSHDYQGLAWQACETSSGALLPSHELSRLAQRYSAISLVDGITALGATELPMDEWGIDVVVGGSQKAFMLPTGMAFLATSEKAEACQSDIPSYYFDLEAEKKANLTGKTRYSTLNHFVVALDFVLKDILQKGLTSHLAGIAELAEHFRNEVSLELFPKTASPSLSCLKVPDGVSAQSLKKKIEDDGFIIVAGQDRLKDKVLRVGHMGAMTKTELSALAKSIESHL